MDLSDNKEWGKNADGTRTEKYCKYCFVNGSFWKEETLEEMVENCIPFRLDEIPDIPTARETLLKEMSELERWQKTSATLPEKL